MYQHTVDFIIVGAGSAGAALANRLTENGRHQVLLLEAGGETHPLSRVPISFARFITRPGVNWLYSSEPEAVTGGRAIPVPRGRMLGGSSAINGMVWVRGQRQDYDHWAQLGNRGWSYQDVLPIFKDMESYAGGDGETRGREGPIKISDNPESGKLYDSFVKAAETVGIKYNRDYNGADQEGIAMTQGSIHKGQRMSTARCYLEPARIRPNLSIETGALAESLIIEGKRCVGVRYAVHGEKREARAAREVIVSAGAIASPQLLELSGIGQAERLKGLGIKVHHDLPGVGENLRDHYAPRMKWRVGRHGVTFNERARGFGALWQGIALHHRQDRLPQPGGLAAARLLQDPRGPRQPGRHSDGATIPRDAQPQAGEGGGANHHYPPASPRQQGQHPLEIGRSCQAARHPLQLPGRAQRPRLRTQLHAHRAAHGRSPAAGVARRRGVPARPEGEVG